MKSRSPWLGEGLWARSHFGQHGTSALLPMPELTPGKGRASQKFNHLSSFCSMCSGKTLPTSADLHRRCQDIPGWSIATCQLHGSWHFHTSITLCNGLLLSHISQLSISWSDLSGHHLAEASKVQAGRARQS